MQNVIYTLVVLQLLYPRPSYLPEVPRPIEPSDERTLEYPVRPHELLDLAENSFSPKYFQTAGRLNVLITEPNHVHAILTKYSERFLKGDEEMALSRALGWGLLADEGEHHARNQTAVSPAFRAAALQKYLKQVTEVSRKHLTSAVHLDQNLFETIREFTQDTQEAAFLPWKTQPSDPSFRDSVLRVSDLFMAGRTYWGTATETLNAINNFKESRETIESYIRLAIDEYLSQAEPEPSLISMFLEVDADINLDTFSPAHQQLSIILQEGLDSISSLINWVLLLLSSRPELWDLLYEESEAQGQLSQLSDMKSMSLHEAVLQEALRLYPGAWILPRISVEEMNISGLQLKRGMRVTLSPYVSHRMSEIFHKPYDFLPERWLDNKTELTPGAYFPFGLGNRICVGQRFAKTTALIYIKAISELGLKPIISGGSLDISSSSPVLFPSKLARVKFVA